MLVFQKYQNVPSYYYICKLYNAVELYLSDILKKQIFGFDNQCLFQEVLKCRCILAIWSRGYTF